LFDYCEDPDLPAAADPAKPPSPPYDLVQCKIAAMERLATSDIVSQEPPDLTKCEANWNSDTGKIVVTNLDGECRNSFTANEEERLAAVQLAAYRHDVSGKLFATGQLGSTVAKLYEFCDTNLSGVDPEECRKEQLALLRGAQVDYRPNDGGCHLSFDYDGRNVDLVVGGGGPNDCATAVEGEVAKGRKDYEEARPTTFAAMVDQFYNECEGRAKRAEEAGFVVDLKKCWEAASKLAGQVQYKYGKEDTCRAIWDSTRSYIVLTGTESACKKAFPQDEKERTQIVVQARAEHELTASLSGATDLLPAVFYGLYTFCDSGAGGDPTVCKQNADALLQDVHLVREGSDCTPVATSVNGKLTIRVGLADAEGKACAISFPDDIAQAEVLAQAAAHYQQTLLLRGASNFAEALNALYAFCDSGAGGDPAACKQSANALLEDVPVVRAGTSCTADIVSSGGKLSVVIGENCGGAFPDDKAARTNEVTQAATRYQRTVLLRGASNLGEALIALYAFCDSGAGGDPAACKRDADVFLTDLPVLRTGQGCAAEVSTTGGKLSVVIGKDCDDAFPDDKTARTTQLLHYRQTVLLRGAGSLGEALAALYAFCDSGAGGDPATCKKDSEALLKDVQVVRTGTGCAADVSGSGHKLTIVVGPDCGAAFPDDPAARTDLVTRANQQYQRTVLLRGATDLASATEALYAFCDSGAGGDPTTCKQDSDALLTTVQVVRTGTSCKPEVSNTGGKPTIAVGPDCAGAFPDDPAVRAAAVAQAADRHQRTALLRGATDLVTAAKALYAFCDTGARGDPTSCKKESDALLEDVPIVRTGASCTAEVSTEGGKPAIVVGSNCGSAFPDDAAARVQAVQEGAKQYATSTAPQLNPPAAGVAPPEVVPPVTEDPVEEAKPPVAESPVEEAKPPVEESPVEEAKPPVEEDPVEEAKPPVEEDPVEEAKPPVEEETAEEDKPAADNEDTEQTSEQDEKPQDKPQDEPDDEGDDEGDEGDN
jgi:hypothetical protein